MNFAANRAQRIENLSDETKDECLGVRIFVPLIGLGR
jgi:hypothetical protein